MNTPLCYALGALLSFSFLVAAGCTTGGEKPTPQTGSVPRTIRVAQQGEADVIGSDNRALQAAADMLRPGDTLVIGPGTYRMDNSLFIPCSDVVVRGTPGETIFFKNPGPGSRIVDGGDYGEKVLVVEEPEKFHAGMGVTVLDDNYNSGWDVTVSSISEVRGDTLYLTQMTLRDYNYETGNARVEASFPILCAIDVENVTFEGITVDGNKDENPYFLDGCRGGGIYLHKAKNCTIRNCVVRNYNGDGISFQITDSITVTDCQSYGNTNYGIHPGTGSSHSVIRNCHFHHNDRIGFFLCWRVRRGFFAENLIENNGLYGISIGHKDTDNLFENNIIRNNGFCGAYFRPET